MSPDEIAALLRAQMDLSVSSDLSEKLARYLELLTFWNARTNLSAIRSPEQIVLRHFGESLQCARALPDAIETLLDYGSGAGFPGMVCALDRPGLRVTLAESQNKKAAFLLELCRTLEVDAVIHGGRAESLRGDQQFDVVTLRAVDRMQAACLESQRHIRLGCWMAILTTESEVSSLVGRIDGVKWRPVTRLRGSDKGVILLGQTVSPATQDVPRGTSQRSLQ